MLKAKATNNTAPIWADWSTRISQYPDRVLFARSMDLKESLENFDPTEQVTLDFLGREIMTASGIQPPKSRLPERLMYRIGDE